MVIRKNRSIHGLVIVQDVEVELDVPLGSFSL
jgi:hypothetical protein